MRILTLGCPLPDPQIDNHDWANAPSFFDYDVIVVDPAGAVSELVEGVLRRGASPLTYTDEPIEDGPTTATSVGLADLLRRRQEETERLLARGGLVVCFAQSDVPHPRVSGFPGCHRYYWLPAPPGLDYGPKRLRPAHGASVSVTNYEHPFADFLERGRHNVLYRALFAEGTEGFGQAARVIGRSAGGAAIAIELSIGSGRGRLPASAGAAPALNGAGIDGARSSDGRADRPGAGRGKGSRRSGLATTRCRASKSRNARSKRPKRGSSCWKAS